MSICVLLLLANKTSRLCQETNLGRVYMTYRNDVFYALAWSALAKDVDVILSDSPRRLLYQQNRGTAVYLLTTRADLFSDSLEYNTVLIAGNA